MSNYDFHDPEFAKELLALYEEIKKTEDESNPFLADLEEKMGMKIPDFESLLHEAIFKRPLYFKVLHPDAVPPSYAYSGDSGFDFYSVDEVELQPLGRALVPTGLSFDVPEGFEIQVRSKSGLAINEGLMVLNSPGTVDHGYTGEIKVIIFNTNNHVYKIKKGQKVGQGVLCPVEGGSKVLLLPTEEITEKDRGENGFGSTGI